MTAGKIPSLPSIWRAVLTGAGWSLAAELVRLVAAITVFLILTRIYEPDQYGLLVGALALLAFLLPQATLGSSYLILQRVAGEQWAPRRALERAAGSVVAGGLAVSVALVAARPVLLPQVPALTLVILCAGELILGGLVEASVFLAQAMERLRAVAAIRLTFGMTRLLSAAALLVLTSAPPLWVWAILAAVSAGATALVGELVTVGRVVGPARPCLQDLRQGLPLSLGFGADKLRENTDAVLLVRLDRPLDAGIFGAAMRLIGVAVTPVVSLLHASNARLYAAGASSVTAARKLATKVTLPAAAYGAAAGLGLVLGGPIFERVLPSDYGDAVVALRWLSLIPLLTALEIFAATALTASGLHRHRVVLNIVGAGCNVGLDLMLIPTHGWRGAIVATVVTALLYVVAVWSILVGASRRERRDVHTSAALDEPTSSFT